MCRHISEHPILEQPQRPRVSFTFDGRALSGLSGQPIAGALLDNGISVLRHTHKTGAPRGIFCGIGQCNDCVVVVNGTPNVRACVTPLEAGMVIETQQGLGKVGQL